MSKKTIALLLAVFMVMSAMCLAGCGNKNAAGSAETAVSGSGTEDDHVGRASAAQVFGNLVGIDDNLVG